MYCLGIGNLPWFYFDSFELSKWQKNHISKKVPMWFNDFAFHVSNHIKICEMPMWVRKTENPHFLQVLALEKVTRGQTCSCFTMVGKSNVTKNIPWLTSEQKKIAKKWKLKLLLHSYKIMMGKWVHNQISDYFSEITLCLNLPALILPSNAEVEQSN